LAIVGCFYPPIPQTTTAVLPQTTGAPSTTSATSPTATTTTTTLPPTTTTMNYCTEEKGMNQPLPIQPNQITSNPSPNQTTPPGDINPTPTPTPGLHFPTMNPQINVTLDQPTTLTVVYLPVDRPNKPSNVNQFTIVFVYPNGTTSPSFNSEITSTGQSTTTTTTTTPSGVPAQPTTTPSPAGVVPPSDVSPQVDLPPNFHVPKGTTIVITITLTSDQQNPHDVCIILLFFILLKYT